jgi:hypothetical protein
MSSLKSVLIGLGITIAASANASLLIEPHLGYIASGGVSAFQGVKYSYTGPQYGARLGVKYLGLMGGFDYTHSTFSNKATIPSLSVTGKQKQDELGVFVGYNAPVLIRAWIGYYFSAKSTYTDNGLGRNGDYFDKGKTTEIGLGFTPLPVLSINLSYRMLSFDKYHQASSGLEGTLSPKYEPKEIVLGVSAPFSLL